MKVAIYSYRSKQFIRHESSQEPDNNKVQLVLGFGAKLILSNEDIYDQLREKYPAADIVLCSTSGEIFHDTVIDDSVSVTAVEFENTNIRSVSVGIDDFPDSYEAGVALMRQFPVEDDLCHIMMISDGGRVNGSKLVDGIAHVIGQKVPVTGGLAGDGANFISTLTGLNERPVSGKIVAVAFYSRHLLVAHGSMGGWETFGPERVVTRSAGNQLYELNKERALDLYKKYLGPYADELPGSALLFPLSVRLAPENEPVVRTILSIDADSGSMIFAGDVPEGSQVRFMKANLDKLIAAAGKAASQLIATPMSENQKLALLISCVGRKLVLGSRVEEEVEVVHEVLGSRTLMTGFYSYGEISPFFGNAKCELHNQTMTITTFEEI